MRPGIFCSFATHLYAAHDRRRPCLAGKGYIAELVRQILSRRLGGAGDDLAWMDVGRGG